MPVLPTQLRFALIALTLVFLGCSDVSDPISQSDTAISASNKSDQSIAALVTNEQVKTAVINGSIVPSDFFLFAGQDLAVFVPLSSFGDTDPTHAVATLNGVHATSSVIVRGNRDFDFMDYTDDAYMAFLFDASSLPPSTQKNSFTVAADNTTIVDDKLFSYSIFGGIEWLDPTVIAPSTVAWLDVSANKIYPSGVILRNNEALTVIISNNAPGSFQDFDFSKASLQGAGESHRDLGHSSGWLNGITGMRVRHFKETADGETGHIIMHFDVSDLDASKSGFQLDYYGKPLSFFAQHRGASRRTTEIDFRNDGEWNYPKQ